MEIITKVSFKLFKIAYSKRIDQLFKLFSKLFILQVDYRARIDLTNPFWSIIGFIF